jgi:hypothetical protein
MSIQQRLKELCRAIDTIADLEDKEVAMAEAIVLTAAAVGPFPGLLVRETGYSECFIENIAQRMQEADLWIDNLVDDSEWCDDNGNLRREGLFIHALVALGRLKREETLGKVRYIDVETGDTAAEWQYSGDIKDQVVCKLCGHKWSLQ